MRKKEIKNRCQQYIEEKVKEFKKMLSFPSDNKLHNISDEDEMKKRDSEHVYYASAYPESIWELDDNKVISFIEEALSTTLTTALAERYREIVGEIERMERELHPSGHHLRRQALSDIKALLTKEGE